MEFSLSACRIKSGVLHPLTPTTTTTTIQTCTHAWTYTCTHTHTLTCTSKLAAQEYHIKNNNNKKHHQCKRHEKANPSLYLLPLRYGNP